jgi:hypothetical protein
MRDPRYRFSDVVRTTTRAIALRMIHAGTVAASPEELDAWIARTDDLRERLTNGGYGSAFAADDLFPLFQSFVAKATAVTPSRPGAGPARWLWIAVILAVVVLVVGVIVAGRMTS